MKRNLRLCVAQMNSTNRYEGNIAFLEKAVEFASAEQCDILALPEVAGLMNRDRTEARRQVKKASDDPFIKACLQLARDNGLWIQNGSTPVVGPDGKFLNHASLINAQGQKLASYDKIHLFDVFLKDRPAFKESDGYAPGDIAALVDTPWGPWGLSICYDLRVPHLYRDYAKAGATVQFVPSAFTVKTGAAHWEVLLRARAIENGCYFIAAAQVGVHDDGRRTWGHSLVVDPWGEVLLDMGGEDAGFATVDLDMNKVSAARKQIASIHHERPYTLVRT